MELNNNDEIEISEDSDAETTTTQIVEEHLIRPIRDFIPPSSTLTKSIAAELSLVYHSVPHGYSYIRQSCTVDLLKKIFNEFHIGQNISCGKTKARE
ncbi:unnamed protein product, partial [Rotaria sordida]